MLRCHWCAWMWRAATGSGAAGTGAMWHRYGYDRRVVTSLRLRSGSRADPGWQAGLPGPVRQLGREGPEPLLSRIVSCRPFEGVQDEIEARLELVAVLVTGLQHVRGGQLGQVGIRVSRHRAHDLLRYLRRLLLVAERQARLLQGEPVDVAVEQRIGVRAQP